MACVSASELAQRWTTPWSECKSKTKAGAAAVAAAAIVAGCALRACGVARGQRFQSVLFIN